MNFSRFFIDRPRFAGVVAVVMVLIGLIALYLLPIAQYPQITPPQIVVSASYPGADSQVLVDTVAVVIENAVNGVEDMLYMESSSDDNGNYTLTITFNIGTDADIAQVKVENRLQQATALLPAVVTQEGLTVRTQSSNILGFLVLSSPHQTYTGLQLSDYAYTHLKNPLERIAGMGNVNIYGPQYSMRVWLNPDKITSLQLTTQDIIQAIENQNVQAAVGAIGAAPSPNSNQVLYLSAQGFLNQPEEFEQIVVAVSPDGGIVRLKDVARVELGADTYAVQATYNNQASVIVALSQLPTANALDVMKAVQKETAVLEKSFPADMQLTLAYNSTDFVRASISGIISTLIITFLLVMLIVFLFLQNLKATLIPMITIPVSLIATFAVLYVLGFNLNILTLFAVILAIGLVVDDAIVVVERVQYLMKYEHRSAYEAAVRAMGDISGAIVATTLVLLAIFVPVGLMVGLTGQIYRQFAVTIIAAVVFSALNALTLSPALCAIVLKEKTPPQKGFFAFFNRSLDKSKNVYLKGVRFLSVFKLVCLALLALVFLTVGLLFRLLPTSFIPQEDQGVLFANLQLPSNSSFNQTQALIDSLTDDILKTEGIQYVMGINGESLLGGAGENIGMLVIGLKPWAERKTSALSMSAIQEKLSAAYRSDPERTIDFFALPPIPGIGSAGGLSFQLNALNPAAKTSDLALALDQFLEALNKSGVFEYAFSTFEEAAPHLYLNIDRTKLQSYHIPVANVFNVLRQNLGSAYVNNITLAGQVNKVIVQADAPYRLQSADIGRLYVASETGEHLPLKEFVTVSHVLSAKSVTRFNQYLSAGITAQAGQGVSTGTAIEAVLKIAQDTLSEQFGIAWTGLSLQEEETQGLSYILIGAALLFAYLFLVALYESWLIAFSVILANGFAVLGALIGLKIMGLSVSLYAQLGMVLLIGLASKNAILIVQFTLSYVKKGQDVLSAAVAGAGERFRAVLMTALTFILGVMPMLFVSGAGAASQHSLGTSVVFGMIAATFIGVFFVPALFALFAGLIYKTPVSDKRKIAVSHQTRSNRS